MLLFRLQIDTVSIINFILISMGITQISNFKKSITFFSLPIENVLHLNVSIATSLIN